MVEGCVSITVSRWPTSERMSAATPWVAEVLPPVSDAVSFLAIAALVCSIYRFAEHLIMPLETRNILRRLNQELKQIQKRSGVLGLWVERVEVWSFHFDGIVSLPAPFPVEIQALPDVAERVLRTAVQWRKISNIALISSKLRVESLISVRKVSISLSLVGRVHAFLFQEGE